MTGTDSPVVVLDTNALMMPVECGVRVFDELARLVGEADHVVPRPVADELDALAGATPGSGGAETTAARVGRDLLERCRIVEAEAEYADDAVVELATAADYVVTNDRPLRDRLLERDVPVIGIRGRNTLAITRP